MLTTRYRSFLSPEALELIQIIESTAAEEQREAAIFALAQRRDENSARVFIEAWETILWRQTKMTLLRALGTLGQERGVEFLIRLAATSDDLPMVAEALLALGVSQSSIAEEFLTAQLRLPDHPLRKELIIALMGHEHCACESELVTILETADISVSLLQFAILAYGHLAPAERALPLERFLSHADAMISNAALLALGRGGGARALELLTQHNTRFRFFAHELKLYALDHLRQRKLLSIEDAVAALLQAKENDERISVLRLLREFPRQEAWDAIMLFRADLKPDLEALLRATVFLPARRSEDQAFILQHRGTVPWDDLAPLIRRHGRVTAGDFIRSLVASLNPEDWIELLLRVAFADSVTLLGPVLTATHTSSALRIACVNALVAQLLMDRTNANLLAATGKLFVHAYKAQTADEVKARILRAVGQIGFTGNDISGWFTRLLEEEHGLASSVYSALSLLPSALAGDVVIKRCKKLASLPNPPAEEMELALHTLSLLGEVDKSAALPQVSEKLQSRAHISLLRILANNKITGYDALITAALGSSVYLECLLGIAAAKHNGKHAHWEKVLHLLDSQNPSLSGRALDTLCVGGGLAEHKRLMAWLEARVHDHPVVLKVMRSMTPKGKENYEPIIRSIDALLAGKAGGFADAEVFTAGVSLRDNLATAHVQFTGGKARAPTHKLDSVIRETLEPFDSYTSAVKSVLRNAELTWHNPELFDELVDRSTMVVEYTKCIDLLLQERIGARLFLDTRGGLLQAMQSRIMQLEFDEPYLNSRDVMRTLQCDGQFEEHAFPLHKLGLICQSIMTGKIVRDQYRMIDGLRAWCVLLLVFGRNFKFRTFDFKPLLPLAHGENQRIKSIGVQLNDLQEVRNRAAHRGILFDTSELQGIRQRSLALLDQIRSLFHTPS